MLAAEFDWPQGGLNHRIMYTRMHCARHLLANNHCFQFVFKKALLDRMCIKYIQCVWQVRASEKRKSCVHWNVPPSRLFYVYIYIRSIINILRWCSILTDLYPINFTLLVHLFWSMFPENNSWSLKFRVWLIRAHQAHAFMATSKYGIKIQSLHKSKAVFPKHKSGYLCYIFTTVMRDGNFHHWLSKLERCVWF